MHPVHGQELYADGLAQDFLRERCRPEALRAYLRTWKPAQKAGIFRLAWLHACRFWFDADDRCLERIDSIVPQHVAISHVLDRAVEAINRGFAPYLAGLVEQHRSAGCTAAHREAVLEAVFTTISG